MTTMTIQNENGNSYTFSGESLHPDHERLENDIRQIACIVQESYNSLENLLYIVERSVQDPPESAREAVFRNRAIEDSAKASVVDLCSALDRVKRKSDSYKGKVLTGLCKNQRMEETWEGIRKWRNKSVAHKTDGIHGFRGYVQGSLISSRVNKGYVSGLGDEMANDLYTVISRLKICIMTVYRESKVQLELRGLQGYQGTNKEMTDEALWDELSSGRSMTLKVTQAQRSIELDAKKLVQSLRSGKDIISAWETTCLDVMNPVRKAWIDLISKISRDPERCKTCSDFVRLVQGRFERLPTRKEVETGIMNGFDGPYGDDNRRDLIEITDKLFRTRRIRHDRQAVNALVNESQTDTLPTR